MPAPTVISISPSVAGSSGGAAATITGTNFTGTTGVTIGGTAATNVVVVNTTTITCTTPAHAVGVAAVLVTNLSGVNGDNSLFIYIPNVPEDTYIYLKGGRGDGFVPLWTGVYSDTLEVSENSEPYRNIFQSTMQTAANGTYGQGSSGSLTVPAMPTSMTNTYLGVGSPISPALTFTATQVSDEVAGEEPRQFVKKVTWRAYTSSNGLLYHFRLADILGVGSQPRSE